MIRQYVIWRENRVTVLKRNNETIVGWPSQGECRGRERVEAGREQRYGREQR
jgi:hypothetical protein